MARHQFRIYQNCPVPKNIAPYIKIICDEAPTGCYSIYRGTDAERLLHSHHKASQADLYNGYIHHLPGYLPANPPGRSTHEQFSDGVAYTGPPGRGLAWWQIGFDVNPFDTDKCIRVAKRHGWSLHRPYDTGVEYHHLNFKSEPKPHSRRMAARIKWLRLTMKRR